jgi:hypothetical protein
MAKKEILEKFKKYKVFFLIKITKGTNLTAIMDRVRGLQSVVVAMPEHSDKLADLSRRNNNFEFYLIKIKFITDKEPTKGAIEIKNHILVGGNGEGKIKGVVFANPKIDTLTPTT